MGKKDKRIDVYIGNAAAFAVPVLNHLRVIVHKACPDVEETIKWGFPHFLHKGILCSMASFKEHCSFGFWKASLMDDRKGIINPMGKTAMGSLGRLQTKKDLPSDKILIDYIKAAAQLNNDGIKLMVKKVSVKKKLVIPDYFTKALRTNKDAQRFFESSSYSHRKEYVEWIKEAKTAETRSKRIATALEMAGAGKRAKLETRKEKASLKSRNPCPLKIKPAVYAIKANIK